MRKICPHIEGGYPGSIGKPPVVKLVNVSVEYVREVRTLVAPDTLIVVRWVDSRQSLNDPPANAARWYIDHIDDMVAMADDGRDRQVAFEGLNEVPDSQAAAYCAFERERLMTMHAVGLRSVVGNWSVGTPDLPTWASYRDALDAMHPQDLIGLHEYWSDNDDISNVWHCGRWQLVPELADKPIVVTECGRDVVEGRGAAGWRRTCNAEQFLADLRAYDALLCQYPNVVGATVFTMGQYASQWAPFDVGQLWPQVVAEQEACVQEAHESATSSTPNPSDSTGLELPVPGARISQAFGAHPEWYPGYNGHPGVDLAAPDGVDWRQWHGAAVHATVAGTAYTIEDASGYGLHVYIIGVECDELLAHLSGWAVGYGQSVSVGQVVGYVGYTGNCKPTGGAGAHLHWGIRPRPYRLSNGYRGYVDPLA